MNDNFIKNDAEETKIIPFEDENGNKIELELIDAFEMDSKEYVALVEPDDGSDEDADVILMRIESVDGEDMLVAIENEDELDRAFDVFKDRMSDEFDFRD